LEFGVWSLEFGVWSLEFGVGSLELEVLVRSFPSFFLRRGNIYIQNFLG